LAVSRSALRAVGYGVLAVMIVTALGLAVWYRATFNVWPAQSVSSRLRWCGRDYDDYGDPRQTLRQISAGRPYPVRPVGQYPPLAFSGQELYAAVVPEAERQAAGLHSCATVVFLRTGPDAYQAYGLLGGP
jgi:hypothetical protein